MKSFTVFLFTFFVTLNSLAAGPFDPKICTGAPLSATRVLELLGPKTSVILPKATAIEKRYRNVVKTIPGAWYPSANYMEMVDYSASLYINVYGSPVVDVKISPYPYSKMTCAIYTDGTVGCNLGGSFAVGDETEYRGYMTDNCMVVTSKLIEKNKETEWGFVLNF